MFLAPTISHLPGFGQTISAPSIHTIALEECHRTLSRVPAGEPIRILDVGSGSGYLTACFAKMVGPGGSVVGIERLKRLADFALLNITRACPELITRVQVFQVQEVNRTLIINNYNHCLDHHRNQS